MAERLIAGVDVGGTKTAVVLGNARGEVLSREEFPSNADRGFDAFFSDLAGRLDGLLAKAPDVRAIGVSIGGPVDVDRGLVLGPPHLPGWSCVPLRDLLRRRCARPVYIEHDAKAGALAEWRFGAGRGTKDLVFLTLGTGLGVGIISGGRLVRGRNGAAGEAGHWRLAGDGPEAYGKRGSWESFSSGVGVVRLAHLRAPGRLGGVRTAIELGALARDGDADACAVVEEAGKFLGRGIALLIDLLAPEIVILGNLARRIGGRYFEAALEIAESEALSPSFRACRIEHSGLGDAIGDVAALSAVLEEEGFDEP